MIFNGRNKLQSVIVNPGYDDGKFHLPKTADLVVTIVHSNAIKNSTLGATRKYNIKPKDMNSLDPKIYTIVPPELQNRLSLSSLTVKQLRWLSALYHLPLVNKKSDMVKRLEQHYQNEELAYLSIKKIEEAFACANYNSESEFAFQSASLLLRSKLADFRGLFDSLLDSNDNYVELDQFHNSFDVLSACAPGSPECILLRKDINTVPTYRSYKKYFDIMNVSLPRGSVPAVNVCPGDPCSKSDIIVSYLYQVDYTDKITVSQDETKKVFLSLPPELLNRGTVELPIEWFAEQNLLEPLLGAFKKEFKSLDDKRVWDVIEKPEGAKLISSKVIYAVKLAPDGSLKRFKVRFVPRGFQDSRKGTLRKEQDCVSHEGLLLSLQLAANKQWNLHTTDFETAFLQAYAYSDDEPKPLVSFPYLPSWLPDGFREALGYREGCCYSCRKAVYGLIDGPRRWYVSICNGLRKAGFRQLNTDLGIWVLDTKSNTSISKSSSYIDNANDILENPPDPIVPTDIHGIVCLHVDDSLHGGNDIFWKAWKQVTAEFIVGETEVVDSLGLAFCGKLIRCNTIGAELQFSVDQEHYAAKLQQIQFQDNTDKTKILDDSEQKSFRSLIGQLNWIGFRTRPDLAFSINILSSKNGKATIEDAMTLNKIARQAYYHRSVRLLFRKLVGILQIVGHTDASFNRLEGSPARIGGIFWVASVPPICNTMQSDRMHYVSQGQSSQFADASPVYWRATSVSRKVEGILDAELIVTQWGYNIAKYIQSISIELGLVALKTPVLILNDNKSNITHIVSTNKHSNPRLNSLWSVVRDSYNKSQLTLRWICGKFKNISDPLTKAKSNLTPLLLSSILRGKIEIPS